MEASKALIAALQSDDQSAMLKVLGPDGKDIISSGDETQDKNDRAEFVQKYEQMHRLVKEPDGATTLYIGAENWPTPIPLMHTASGWYFDTAAGKKEILYRRIGKNELNAIQVCRELVDAQKEFKTKAHDGDSVNQYAQKFFSDPDKHNGLYWTAAAGEEQSPIGPLVASAEAEGYKRDTNHEAQPFMGYYFRGANGAGSECIRRREELFRERKNDTRICVHCLSSGVPVVRSDDVYCESRWNCLRKRSGREDGGNCESADEIRSRCDLAKSGLSDFICGESQFYLRLICRYKLPFRQHNSFRHVRENFHFAHCCNAAPRGG